MHNRTHALCTNSYVHILNTGDACTSPCHICERYAGLLVHAGGVESLAQEVYSMRPECPVYVLTAPSICLKTTGDGPARRAADRHDLLVLGPAVHMHQEERHVRGPSFCCKNLTAMNGLNLHLNAAKSETLRVRVHLRNHYWALERDNGSYHSTLEALLQGLRVGPCRAIARLISRTFDLCPSNIFEPATKCIRTALNFPARHQPEASTNSFRELLQET